jgi:hypothetical protein
MTLDPYDIDNRTTAGPAAPEDPYVRRPYDSAYGGSGIAFVIFGVVAVLLIGFAMFGSTSDNPTATSPQITATEQAPQVQPQQPAATPEPTAPATNDSGSANQ